MPPTDISRNERYKRPQEFVWRPPSVRSMPPAGNYAFSADRFEIFRREACGFHKMIKLKRFIGHHNCNIIVMFSRRIVSSSIEDFDNASFLRTTGSPRVLEKMRISTMLTDNLTFLIWPAWTIQRLGSIAFSRQCWAVTTILDATIVPPHADLPMSWTCQGICPTVASLPSFLVYFKINWRRVPRILKLFRGSERKRSSRLCLGISSGFKNKNDSWEFKIYLLPNIRSSFFPIIIAKVERIIIHWCANRLIIWRKYSHWC